MNTLIVYASRHGATAGIAERIGETLRNEGLDATVLPVSRVVDPIDADSVIVGSAVYMGRWLKEAAQFVRLHQSELAARPLWLFSSGPVGPKELPVAEEIAEFRKLLEIRDHRTFAGAIDAKKVSLAERLMVKAVKAPYGDDRNWNDIELWAKTISAKVLQPA